MDVSLEGSVYDPSRCSKLSMEQKKELVYELSNWPDGAAEILHSWSRQEILQILCAELGKERKYTGLTKSKIIEQLLKIVWEKKSQQQNHTSENDERTPKRQRKFEHSVPTSSAHDVDSVNTVFCKNSACKAKMSREDVFCKRCSCCICRQYDDNKDPSLWLICNSDPPFQGVSCGMSCHLECALRHEKSGISKDRLDKELDGSFCCVSCGKVNDMLGSWRKQLVVARDTRRVDILCYRLSLCQKILAGSKHYQNLCGLIDEAVEKLEEDVGPLTGLPVKKARGIVNRLSSGPEIQTLCSTAIDSLDSILSQIASSSPSDGNGSALSLVRFEDICDSSITVILDCDDMNETGCLLWHRKADDMNYLQEPSCKLFSQNMKKFLLSGLSPDTDYFLKIVATDKDRETGHSEIQFRTKSCVEDGVRNLDSKNLEVERSHSPATNCSTLSNPSSVEDETNNAPSSGNDDKSGSKNLLLDDNTNGSDLSEKETNNGDVISLLDEEHTMNGKDPSHQNGLNTRQPVLDCVPYSESALQITPCKTETMKGTIGRKNKRKANENGNLDTLSKRDEEEPQAGSSSKKRSGERRDKECSGIGDKDFEYYVKVIWFLECDGYIETEFRQKFLTWYSLRASPQEVRIVKVFIDTFVEDPESLAGQLLDTFSDVVSNKRRCSTVPSGFCLKLWH